jgi:CheY-like chemotaxis protein
VLLDLNLPVVDGSGVLRSIRGGESLRGLPVIVLSNSSYFSGAAQSAWEAGATAFLNKGDHSPQSLVHEVGKLLKNVTLPPPKPTWHEPPPLPFRAFIKAASGQIPVIVTDDDKVIHGVLGFLMEQAGFHVRSAYDGRRALETAEADPPHILILDGKMPGLDGLEVPSLWHKNPVLSRVPVIMLTTEKSEA